MRNIIDWKASCERKSIKTRGFSWCTLVILTLTFAVFVTERSLSHVTQANWALAAAVGEGVTLLRVKLCGGDHFRQLLHVGGLDVHNVWETSIKEQPWLSRVLLTFSTWLTALMVDKRQLWWALTNLFLFTQVWVTGSERILKLRSVISRFHRFTRRSSVEMNVWRSELTEMELMW